MLGGFILTFWFLTPELLEKISHIQVQSEGFIFLSFCSLKSVGKKMLPYCNLIGGCSYFFHSSPQICWKKISPYPDPIHGRAHSYGHRGTFLNVATKLFSNQITLVLQDSGGLMNLSSFVYTATYPIHVRAKLT